MAQTSEERSEFEEYSWTECPHCGTRFLTWDPWFGRTLWVRDLDAMVPVPKFRFCPNCGEKLEGGSDGTD